MHLLLTTCGADGALSGSSRLVMIFVFAAFCLQVILCKLCCDGCLWWFVFCFQDNKDLYAEEAAAQRERERQRMLAIPGLIAPSELQDEMVDS